MTFDKKWDKADLGQSGETYLVGADYLLRSQSRFLFDDPKGYKQALMNSGMSNEVIDKIFASGSAIGIQAVKSVGAIASIAGKTGIQSIKDYRNVDVLCALHH